jgi:hypothetical protein
VIVHVILHPDLQTPDFYIFTFGRSWMIYCTWRYDNKSLIFLYLIEP